MSKKPGSGAAKGARRDWRTGSGGPPPTQAPASEAPSMSRSRVQLATAYAPDVLFTWEGAKGICRSVPVSRPATDVKSTTRLMIFQGIKEAATSWYDRAKTVRDAKTIPDRLVLDSPFFDERTGEVVIDELNNFKLTRPDRIGYIPYPLLYRCGICGRLREFDSVDEQARYGLPECNGHQSRWSQVDVVYVHWSGGLQPLSPFHFNYNEASGGVSRINQCECGSTEFKLLNDAPVFSDWRFVCLGCGAARQLKQSDPYTLNILEPRKATGERHDFIEINMLPVSYRANSAYYVQKGYFIDFEDRRVVDLMMPQQRPELTRFIAALHQFAYDEPSEETIKQSLEAAGKPNEYKGWETFKTTATQLRDLGLIAQAEDLERKAVDQRESWFRDPNPPVKRGRVRSQALANAVESRIADRWTRRYDPLHLTVEHDIFVREHITQRIPRFEARDVMDPDRLLSEAANDATKMEAYTRAICGRMREIGVDRIVLIRGLPVCEYTYGYSRVSAGPIYAREQSNRPTTQMPVRLNAFPYLPESRHHPVYVLEQNNEALYIKLSETRVRAWLSANGVTPTPYEGPPGIAGTYLEQYRDFGPYLDDFKGHEGRSGGPREFCPYVTMLIHSLSHQFIHALSELSGLDRDGIGEHLFPADLAFVVYRKGMTPDLGNISAMWRNFGEAFLERILEPRLLRCGSGSLCDARGGACPACIMVPDLTCIASNQLLSRSALKGGPPPTWEDRNGPSMVGYFDPALQ